MRVLAIALLTASGLAAADPVTDLTDSDDAPDDAAVAALRAFAAHTTEPTDRAVIANVKLGEALRRRACPVPLVDGLCVQLVATPPGRFARCAPGAHAVAIARDPALAGEASSAFQRAMKAADDHAPLGARARAYYLRARLGEIDRQLDAYLAHTLPPMLDFDPRHPAIAAASKKQVQAWLESRELAATALATRYHALVDLGDPATTIEALARLAQIQASFANELLTAPLPPVVLHGSEEVVETYCDAVITVAEPLESAAIDRYAMCYRRSSELGWFTAASAMCERELSARKPETWPMLTELRPAPGGSAPITEIAPPR